MHSSLSSTEEGGLARRKAQHLEICLDQERFGVETSSTRLDEVRLIHRALPEVDASRVDTGMSFLGIPCRLPIFISSMTGGSRQAYQMNKDLATLASELGIPVGMGSIRILLRKPQVIDDFRLKRFAPSVPVFANIGGVQLPRTSHDSLYRLLETLQADGIAIHLNPGQELFQPEGDRDFRGVLEAISRFIERSPVPVMVKETGFGIAPREVNQLFAAGASYVDLAGAGGTNWVRVESFRSDDPLDQPVAGEFDTWGIPTGLALAALGRNRRGILASGGIRTGLEVVTSLALGAEAAGMALPFVRELSRGGIPRALALGEELARVIRNALVLTGCTGVAELRRVPLLMGEALLRDAASLRADSLEKDRPDPPE
ncbi:type 2 isopentenyl-diphosphate Delta-isomerase [Alkalispirochaeta sphaeroplastigenens]|uniref:Isopentenyl-diphosphate delta-isomerase n=1 Tax=Alkalispirochaeta sphaeroplastigenens TaxID=1187066 RepID=A0A2S4JX88_9SPIO|nr:type 2 isopentenyl-diphosphate Delta-isomerase [Alkalispirochaeta sphaeroplastigenens]POR04124.1 type 2 isopentenyl-diphosphate Delta-isomerase [Alkalispirochaeta sphaeroplastigenens]